jgi:5'(3')-deoxyribonucleotidase
MKKRGRLDLDGVIVNFSKGLAKKYDIPYPEGGNEIDFYTIFGTQVGKQKINKTLSERKFWADLEPYDWANTLVDFFDKTFGDDWVFVTKGFVRVVDGELVGSESFTAKVEWVFKHFPNHIEKLWINSRDKGKIAGPNDFLLDDDLRNINSWLRNGGKAFHWKEITSGASDKLIKDRLNEFERYIQRSEKTRRVY